jgi:hypothetical protein
LEIVLLSVLLHASLLTDDAAASPAASAAREAAAGSTGEDGPVSVRATDPSTGLIFNLLGVACETEYSNDCLGINMQVRYDADGQETLERNGLADLVRDWPVVSTG